MELKYLQMILTILEYFTRILEIGLEIGLVKRIPANVDYKMWCKEKSSINSYFYNIFISFTSKRNVFNFCGI